MSAPTRLRVEHLDNGVSGLGDRRPRLSWLLPENASYQDAYCVELNGRALDRIESCDSVLVPWPGAPLTSRQHLEWRVKVWTDLGESEWSQPAWFETGLLDAAEWVAEWIEPYEPVRADAGERPAYVLRLRFVLDSLAPDARLYATAHGCYETFLNGQRVGDLELTPGFTSYESRLDVQTYDVTDLLVAGENIWTSVLSDGWYRGRTGFGQVRDSYGDTVAFLGQLHVGDTVVATDESWQSSTGAIVAADLMAGQREDRRLQPEVWHPVTVVHHDRAALTVSPSPPVRRVEEVRPVDIRRIDAGRQVVDLGQNINGWVRLTDLGPADTELTLVHGEALDAAGDVTQDHLAGGDHTTGGTLPVGQTDHVVSAGREDDRFEPRHTMHGFQYVRIEGHPHRLTPYDVTGIVVHTDFRRTGWFRCSDERLNRFHEIADWSFRDNACAIPTDCPQRERSGWTGDWQVFLPSAAFLYDVAGFSLDWLRDLAIEQRADGRVRNYAPDPLLPRHPGGTHDFLQGSAGWGDAIVMVPWMMSRIYRDDGVLAELWPAMLRWVEYASQAARSNRSAERAAARPDPAPHEAYLWDTGFHWGEWLEPSGGEWEPDQGHVATAFLHHSASLVARIGRLLGHDHEAERFQDLATCAADAWRTEYVDAEGRLTPDTQATHVRALAFGLVDDQARDRTAARLVELIRQAGTHLGTGFLATPYLLPVLADTGHLDVAYELLLQDTPPSWLTMVVRGATTVWEDWDGLDEDRTPKASLNHYSKGAVIAFLHEYVAGVQLLDDHPGYQRFRIAPQLGGRLTWAEAVHDSPYGRIESSWRIEGGSFHLTVVVPPGTTAAVLLPDGTEREQTPGIASYECSLSAPGAAV